MSQHSEPQSKAPISNKLNDISFKVILKVIFAIGLVMLLTKIYTIGLLIFLALLLAVSLEPIVQKLQRLRIPRGVSISIIAISMMGIIALFVTVLIPAIFDQTTTLIKSFPDLKKNILTHIPENMALKSAVTQLLDNPKLPDATILMNHAMAIFNSLFGGMAQVFLVLIFSLYLLVDGKRSFQWIADFFSAPTKIKLHKTADETSVVIHSYVIGQAITSVLSFVYTLVALSLLKVPAALTLATLAGIFDILPILGFFMAVVPAVLLAITISPMTGLTVIGIYILYHAIENYLIIPFVYGSSMKVSSLVVLIALLIAGSTSGVLGAIAILPVVASYPIIERIWLAPYLGGHVVEKHAKSEGSGH